MRRPADDFGARPCHGCIALTGYAERNTGTALASHADAAWGALTICQWTNGQGEGFVGPEAHQLSQERPSHDHRHSTEYSLQDR